MARGDLTDAEWSLIGPCLPLGERGPIPDLRRQFNAAMWRFRTGSPWRDLPAEYGPWSTVYDRFRLWATTGTFEQLMQAMIDEAAARGQADLDLVSVDSTTARAHQHAAGMSLDPELVQVLEEIVKQEKGQKPQSGDDAINRIKEWRGLAFRFDKTPDSYLAGLHLRGAILWIRSLQPL
ncbi:transposase [Microbispora sp. NPDC088329]|uniref:transposase n=1 Tax=Microbispora sp. NPDC088329 TaxID=3154869 RepID=UPI00344372D4